MNAAERVLDSLHLRRHSAETEVKVEDPEGIKVKIKEPGTAPAQDPPPEHDVHPVTTPATDPAGAKVVVATIHMRSSRPGTDDMSSEDGSEDGHDGKIRHQAPAL